MSPDEIASRFSPALDQMIDECRLTEEFIDKERFQVMIATVWGNAVLDPPRSGVEEADLEALHDFICTYLEQVIGPGATVAGCFEFIVSKAGEDSLARLAVTQRHREFLTHFARLILAGDGSTGVPLHDH